MIKHKLKPVHLVSKPRSWCMDFLLIKLADRRGRDYEESGEREKRKGKALMLNNDDSCKVCLRKALLGLRIIELPARTFSLMELMERLMPLMFILIRHCMDNSISLRFCCPESWSSARHTRTTGASAGKQQGAVYTLTLYNTERGFPFLFKTDFNIQGMDFIWDSGPWWYGCITQVLQILNIHAFLFYHIPKVLTLKLSEKLTVMLMIPVWDHFCFVALWIIMLDVFMKWCICSAAILTQAVAFRP